MNSLFKFGQILTGSTALFFSGCTLMEKQDYQLAPMSFNQTAAEVTEGCKQAMTTFKADLDTIGALNPSTADFADSFLALERATTKARNDTAPLTFLKYSSTDKDVRGAADACETQLEQLFVESFAREDLYKVLSSASERSRGLGSVEDHLRQDILERFLRNGLGLSAEKRAEYVALKKELIQKESDFSKALIEDATIVEFDRSELEGLPEDFFAEIKPGPNGKYPLTLQYPHAFPVLEDCKNAATRQKMLYHFDRKGGEANLARMARALELRQKMAVLLGYKNHAEFVLKQRMAGTPAQVQQFLSVVRSRLGPLGRSDLANLVKAKQTETGNASIKTLEPHDWRYYENLIKKQTYQVDMEKVREYFPVTKVIDGMFQVYQTLLNVRFQKVASGPRWHDEATLYEVIEANGQRSARFYLDLFPRKGKYGHAAAFTLRSGYRRPDGLYEAPIAAVLANFTAPTAGKPSLLTHDEVETLFHEFGHIMHQVLTRAQYASFSGTSVKQDFVEAPSQMLENWVWKEEPLRLASAHYKTGEPLPQDLMKRLIALKNYNNGIRYLRQVMFAMLDMEYHTKFPVKTTEVYRRLAKEVMLIPIADGTYPEASFGHLMGGYDAGYYGYLWSKVYSSDMFTRFDASGLLNAATGADYRKYILEPGDEVPPLELLKRFIGREPTSEAFFKDLGI